MPDNNQPQLLETVVPWWQDGSTTSDQLKEPYFLSKGIFGFFNLIKSWLLFPLKQSDALTCNESLLNLMAWDRDTYRFEGESTALFRKRIKYAPINQQFSI